MLELVILRLIQTRYYIDYLPRFLPSEHFFPVSFSPIVGDTDSITTSLKQNQLQILANRIKNKSLVTIVVPAR